MSGQEMIALITDKLRTWLEALVSNLPNLALAVVVLVIFWLLAKGVRGAVRRALRRTSDNQAVNRLIGAVTYLVLLGAGLFFALGILELDKTVTSLLAGAGIIGLALAFAFQDAAENLVSGITIAITQPFRAGDFIETNDHAGTVEDISLRTTSIRRPQGQLVLIPNSSVFKNPLVNWTETSDRRVDLEVGVSYDTDLEHAKQVAIDSLDGLPGRNSGREVELFYTGYGASSIDFVIRFWLTDAYQGSFMAARSDAIQQIKTAFDREGIEIPFPIRTLDLGSDVVEAIKN